jgi:hypothetical protein
MMAGEEKDTITLHLGGVKEFKMTIKPSERKICQMAEDSVNKFWGAWKTRYDGLTSEEVMSRIAFQFARLYIEAKMRNAEVNDALESFEEKLNELLVKVKREE